MKEEGKEENKEQRIIPRIRRDKSTAVTPKREPPAPSVTAGSIDRVVDLAFNPSWDKIREMTSIDRIQGRLLPQLDVIDVVWQHVIEISFYRQDADEYKRIFERDEPVPPLLISEFTHRTAQWQKSVLAMNLKSAIDLALAEVETRGDEGEGVGIDAWKD